MAGLAVRKLRIFASPLSPTARERFPKSAQKALTKPLHKILKTRFMDRISKHLKRNIPEQKLISGFDDLDAIIHSFDKSNLYVLAGRPGMGKTAFGLTLIHYLALMQNANVVVISYEMTIAQIVSRLLAISSGLSSSKILQQDLEDSENIALATKTSELESANIYIDCPAALNFKGLNEKIKEFKAKNSIDFLFIDDIQRISISEDDRKYASNREQEVSKNVRDLKSLAKELNIPILAISQLNRDNKDRTNPKPILTDIRDSGAIENDSDVVILLHRPDYYGITEDENGNSLLGIAVFEIAKNRHGSIGEFELSFKRHIPKFENIVNDISEISAGQRFSGMNDILDVDKDELDEDVPF